MDQKKWHMIYNTIVESKLFAETLRFKRIEIQYT